MRPEGSSDSFQTDPSQESGPTGSDALKMLWAQAEGTSTGPSEGQSQAQADVLATATSVAEVSPAGASILPAVLGDTPVAVLLINRVDGMVTFANWAAIELAGDVGLPVAVDAWGAAAGLTDLSGTALAGTDAPLSRVAGGHPVAGEPVRMQPARSDDADRAKAATGADAQVLWVTGFPLYTEVSGRDPGEAVEAPLQALSDHQDLSLVVFLPITEGQALDGAGEGKSAGGQGSLQRLQQQAIAATDVCFAISDPRQEDNPLVWVNSAFTRVTGYELAEVAGRNCRFLQGPSTDPGAVATLREAIAARQPVTVTLLNYRADDTAFWNQLSLTPVFDGTGELVSFVGVQSDVTARISVERARQTAFAAEQLARRVSEAAHRRLQLMAEASATLAATLEVDVLLDRLAGLCVPALAECAFIARVDDEQLVTTAVIRHAAGLQEELADLIGRVTGQPFTPGSPAADALGSRTPVVLAATDPGTAAGYTDPDVAALPEQVSVACLVAVPLTARGVALGVLVVTSSTPGVFDTAAVEVLTDLAGRAGLALDNARLYQGQRSVAETLQRALLTDLPDLPGIQAAAHYESASAGTAVGGDFYDLMARPDGSIGISIGDVTGHDIQAAATMGRLRGLLQASAYDSTRPDPADVLNRVDELMAALNLTGLATLAHVHAHRPDGPTGDWRLDVANAGHPPLVVRTPDGQVRLLEEVRGLILGVDPTTVRVSTTVRVPQGSVLVAYTDGLIERRDQDLDQGLARLTATLADQPAHATAAQLCTALLDLADQPDDDVALIVVRLL